MVTPSYRRAVVIWLLACAALVACMVLVGGYTRLSGSGLSITEWKPIHGVIPPLNLAEWQEEFAAYQASPQYAKVNAGMTLEEFKTIFWPEFWHRVLGRAIGIVFFIPFLYFAARRAFPPRYALRLLAIFALGGAQGLMGWYMVKSGLVDDPYVSHLRLSAHLALAFLLFGLLWWNALDLGKRQEARGKSDKPSLPSLLPLASCLLFSLLCLQILYGAFMAGLHAGLIYNTFPTMNGAWIPPNLFSFHPWWINFVENIDTVQFIHRWLAKLIGVATLAWYLRFRRAARADRTLSRLMLVLLLVVAAQIGLGIATLLLAVPLNIALIHQFMALVLFALMLAILHRLRTVFR